MASSISIRRRLRTSPAFWLLLIPLIGLLFMFAYPLLDIVWRSFSHDGELTIANYVDVLTTGGTISAIEHSLLVSLAAGFVSVLLGLPMAYALERSRVRCQPVFKLALALPLLAPSLVQGLGILFLFGPGGLLSQWTSWDGNIYGFWGLLVSDVFWTLPQCVMILQSSLRDLDARPYEAASAIGASRWRQFTDLTIPAIRFGLFSAWFVGFILTITDFGNAFVISGRYNVLAMEMYNEVIGLQNFRAGAVVGVLLLIPSLFSIYIERVGRRTQAANAGSNAVPLAIERGVGRDFCLGTVCWVVSLFIFAVVAIVVYVGVIKLWPYNHSFTLQHFMVDTAGAYESLVLTLEISVVVAIVGLAALFAFAFGVTHVKGLLSRFAYIVGLVPLGVPGLVLGLSYLLVLSTSQSPLGLLYGTAILIGICNFYHYHTQGFLTMMAGMQKVPSAVEDAVSVLGGRTRHVIRDAVWPFVREASVDTAFYLFMRSMVTLSAVIFLVTASIKVASTTIMNLQDEGFQSQAAAFSTLIMAIIAVAMLILEVVRRRASRRAVSQST